MENNQALLVIDIQHGLLQRKVFNKQILINNINSLLYTFHEHNKPVFLIRHTNSSFSRENSDDWQIYNKLDISAADILINKSHSSVFKEKQFISLLKEKNIASVVIAGLVSNGCVQAACLDAKQLGFSVILISDAHSTFHKDAENVVLDWNIRLKDQGIKLLSTADFLNYDSFSS